MRITKILTLLACLMLAACGKGGNTTNSTTVSNTTNATRSANVAASPSPSAAANPSPAAAAKVTKPEDAAQGLFNAWKTKDRAAASRFAANAAIDNLFKEGGPEGLRFQGCDKQEEDYLCGYSYEGGGLMMTVTGSDAEGYKVMSTAFIAD